MTERLNVLYLPHPAIPDTNDPERVRTLEDLLVDRHNFFIFDPDQPIAPQFAEIDFVIDVGGSVCVIIRFTHHLFKNFYKCVLTNPTRPPKN